MPGLGRRVASVSCGAAVVVLTVVGRSYAGRGGLQRCLDQAVDHNGEQPTCTKVDGQWVASWPDDSFGAGGGFPSGFAALFALVLLVGVAVTVWKVGTARRLATRSGMDPGMATQMTLLTDDGLDATYLAANLRQHPSTAPAPGQASPSTTPTATGRLEELKALLDRGLVTQAEYDERRKAIIDSV